MGGTHYEDLAPLKHALTPSQAGVTHCFVNLGSDHPSIIEAIVKGQSEKKGQFPRIITCPNEVRPLGAVFPPVHTDHVLPLYRWSPSPWLTATPA